MEVKTHFCEASSLWCSEHEENLPELKQLLNYINTIVWNFPREWEIPLLNHPNIFYTPPIFLMEDKVIAVTTIVDYEFYNLMPKETEEYIMNYCPCLLDKLSPALFFLLFGRMDMKRAEHCVNMQMKKFTSRH